MKRERVLQVGTVLFSTTLVVAFLSCEMKKANRSAPKPSGEIPATQPSTPPTQSDFFLPSSKSPGGALFTPSKEAPSGGMPGMLPPPDGERSKTVMPGSKSAWIIHPADDTPSLAEKLHINPPATAPATQP